MIKLACSRIATGRLMKINAPQRHIPCSSYCYFPLKRAHVTFRSALAALIAFCQLSLFSTVPTNSRPKARPIVSLAISQSNDHCDHPIINLGRTPKSFPGATARCTILAISSSLLPTTASPARYLMVARVFKATTADAVQALFLVARTSNEGLSTTSKASDLSVAQAGG